MSVLFTGKCGVDLAWELNQENGLMTISGKGPMTDFMSEKEAPWYEQREEIRELVLEEGVTTLGDYSFVGCKNMGKVTIPSTLEIFGTYSLKECICLTEVVIPEGARLIGAKVFSACTGLRKVRIPLSVKAIDMKAFEMTAVLEEVVYAGTKEQWKQIRISRNACGNKTLLGARFTYLGEDEIGASASERGSQTAETNEKANRMENPGGEAGECIPVYEIVRKVLEQGGDGKLHILSVDLTTPDIPGKQGDCTILIFPGGETMMIDAGVHYCEERVMNALRSLGLTSLDYFAVSHPHIDHVGNALAVAKYIYERGGTIGTYFYMGHHFKVLEPTFAKYLQGQGVTMDNYLRAGAVRQIGEVGLEILGPSGEKTVLSFSDEHVNSLSMMMKFSYGNASYLTCGDLYRSDELEAIENYGEKLKVTVAKANHHGAYTSNCPEWLETVYPALMIVQSDDIGATLLAERAERMGIEYYSVGLDGSVLVTLDKDGSVEAQTACGKVFIRKGTAD